MKTTIQEIYREVYPGLSLAEGRRTTALGGIRFNGEEVTHMDQEVDLKDGDIFQRGKHHKRVRNGNGWDHVEQIEPYTQYRMTLTDDCDEKPKTLELRARSSGQDHMLMIGAEGYGEMTAADGAGYPILLEHHEGKLRLIVWQNINSEEPTILSLEGAREDAREGADIFS